MAAMTTPLKHGAALRVVVECQRSYSSLAHEEERIRDLNLTGRPVLLVVATTAIRDTGSGLAAVDLWVQHWAHRHGRQQVAAMAPDGRLFWCWFDKAAPHQGRREMRHVEIVPGMRSAVDPRYELQLCVDSTRPSLPRSPSLLVAAFSWMSSWGSMQVPWQDGPLHRQPPNQPSAARLPLHRFLGTEEGQRLFAAKTIEPGGF